MSISLPVILLGRTRQRISILSLVGFFIVFLMAQQVTAAVIDTDGDGIPDDYEVSHGLDPLNAADASLDNDHDGISNLAEYTAGTDPNNRDSDGDGIVDGYEVSHGLDPLNPSDATSDNDHDGTPNLMEYHAGTDLNSPDIEVDDDGDGIPNLEEEDEGDDISNPHDSGNDNDGDGFSNLEEYIGQSNPKDPLSIPAFQTVLDGNNGLIRLVHPPNVTVNTFNWIDPSTLPPSNTPGVTMPYGLISMDFTVTIPGEHVKVALTFPGHVDPLSSYDHFGATNSEPTQHWVSNSVGSDDGDTTIILNLTDGGEGDDDLVADGTIHAYPGGPVLLVNAKLGNISTRSRVRTGDNQMIGGFIIDGTTPKTVLIRGRGPSMGVAPFNISGVLSNPNVRLFSGQQVIAQNDDWQTSDPLCDAPAISCGGVTEILSTGIDPCQPNSGQVQPPLNCDLESAIYVTLPPGPYTAIMNGVNGGTGVGLVEVFEISSTGAEKLANISTRSRVETGNYQMIGGVIIDGTTPKTVLIRGRGPSLGVAPFNLPGVLSNPNLRLFSGQQVIAQNDDWQTTDPLCSAPAVACGGSSAIKATGIDPCQPNPGQTGPPANCSLESALYVTLSPGAYTAIMNGVNGGTGVGIVEVFELK